MLSRRQTVINYYLVRNRLHALIIISLGTVYFVTANCDMPVVIYWHLVSIGLI
jgi:hypothetical protein